MKIVVFGASRGVGSKVVEQALEAGHIVTAFVRSPEKFGVRHPNLSVVKGDSLDAAAVENARHVAPRDGPGIAVRAVVRPRQRTRDGRAQQRDDDQSHAELRASLPGMSMRL